MVNPREMLWPVTLGAKFRRFPYGFYWSHFPFFRYLIMTYVVLLPIPIKLCGAVTNKEYVADYRKKERDLDDWLKKYHVGHLQREADDAHFGYKDPLAH